MKKVAHWILQRTNVEKGDLVQPLCMQGSDNFIEVEQKDVRSTNSQKAKPGLFTLCSLCLEEKRSHNGVRLMAIVGEQTTVIPAVPPPDVGSDDRARLVALLRWGPN